MDFKENLSKVFLKEEVNALLEELKKEDTHALLVNTNKVSKDDILKLFPLLTPHPYVDNAFIYDKNIYPLGKSVYHELGYFYLQDPSAMMVASLVDIKPNDKILDMCAAPGGKTIGASLKLKETGSIISNDISFSRCKELIENIERLGLDNIVVINNDLEQIYHHYQNKFDVIFLDAPCSGSGMFRKDNKMMEDWSINKVYKFAELQKRLIDIAYFMLKPGGTLSYSTCSYSLEEDEEVIEHLLSHSDAQIVKLPEIKEAYINPNKPIGIRLTPLHFKGEGQYICQIRKPGNNTENQFLNENKYKKLLPDAVKNFDVIKVNDTYYALRNKEEIKHINVLRYGKKVGYEQKGIFHFDLHFAKSLKANEFPSVELNIEEIKKYFEGNPINKNNPFKGFVLLTHQNVGVDIAKTDGLVIKNNYPKGRRRKYQ